MKRISICLFLVLILTVFRVPAQEIRKSYSLDKDWQTIAHENDSLAFQGFEGIDFPVGQWQSVDVPHNWDAYDGYRRLLHGNKHGYAWYRKKFSAKNEGPNKRYFLYFEGVSSYASVWLNGKKVGYHAGGRTTFTLDVTDAILFDQDNILAVRADHPASIRDLPWVCGGCSEERGFSEGSQPMGIFRPVHLEVTDAVRIEPFGVHVWNDTTVTEKAALIQLETEIKNYGKGEQRILVKNKILDARGKLVKEISSTQMLSAGNNTILKQQLALSGNVHLWSPDDPYLYTVLTEISSEGKTLDRLSIPYGIRWVSWPIDRAGDDKRLFINGKPFFINGIAEYEHMLGGSHAFSEEQISARVKEIQAAGFNAFRDAHQPHNLRYQAYWDQLGLVSWPQLSAHIWFDNEAFRQNYKRLLTDWIKERRNSPSAILWGLENESVLPEAFARECVELIRQLDPTASSQRKITTCNGGTGTDWDVPQNWTGTYGGDPATYAQDLKKQLLVGEYGAWRTLDFHAERPYDKASTNSENRMSDLMQTKVRLAEQMRDSVPGHFFWLFNSHDNPGRIQAGEGMRELDRIGPVNYKGLFTSWDEPTDVYYMFRSQYADSKKEPMVYLVSHTWPDRWTTPGVKSGIEVYSNCEEVELFNDLNGASLGRKQKKGIGTSLIWDEVPIQYNVLVAKGYIGGKEVAKDLIVLRGLPEAPSFKELYTGGEVIQTNQHYQYLYRVNCGGPAYTDQEGHVWEADRGLTDDESWGSRSWTANFDELPTMFASQRQTHDPIRGTANWALFQSFRYGREQLSFQFPVPDGQYEVELYFIEPWFGTGGGVDATGWRLFDIAVNDRILERNVDLWKEAGHDVAIKKTYTVDVKGGQLKIHFPHIAVGQALISAIAIATKDAAIKPAPAAPTLLQNLFSSLPKESLITHTWLDAGDQLYSDSKDYVKELPPVLYGAEWIQVPKALTAAATIRTNWNQAVDIFLLVPPTVDSNQVSLKEMEDTKNLASVVSDGGEVKFYKVFRKRFERNTEMNWTFAQADLPICPMVVVPVTKLQSPHDLKPTISYKPTEAVISKGIEPIQFLKKDALEIPAAAASIQWKISTGVGDTYSITVRYSNETGKTMLGTLILRAADGSVLLNEKVQFVPSKTGKWGYLYTDTGTMINAGNYQLELSLDQAEGLIISNLDIQ